MTTPLKQMDRHHLVPRSLLTGGHGPAFGAGFGSSGGSSNSGHNQLMQLGKADGGRIVFEGRNFSKCVA